MQAKPSTFMSPEAKQAEARQALRDLGRVTDQLSALMMDADTRELLSREGVGVIAASGVRINNCAQHLVYGEVAA